jgi:hypothetical protein
MPHCLHDELSDRDRLIAMQVAVFEIRDIVSCTRTVIEQSRTMLREIETDTGTLIDRRSSRRWDQGPIA